MLIRSSLLLTALISAGCATTAATPTPAERVIAVDERTGSTVRTPSDLPARVVLPASVDKAWDAVASSYAMLEVDLAYVNRPAGEQGNRKFTVRRTFFNRPVSTYLNCGDDPLSGPNANAHPVTMSLVTRVRSEGTGTALETMLSGTLTKPGASGEIYCATTGELEVQLADMIASRLNR